MKWFTKSAPTAKRRRDPRLGLAGWTSSASCSSTYLSGLYSSPVKNQTMSSFTVLCTRRMIKSYPLGILLRCSTVTASPRVGSNTYLSPLNSALTSS